MGYVIQVPFILVVMLLGFVWQFFDSFYNRLIVQWIFGYSIPWAGFVLSIIFAFILGFISETKSGWSLLSKVLEKIPLAGHVGNIIESWKTFRGFAEKQGIIIAPFYREKSTYWPGIVTTLIPKDNGRYLVTVVFAEIPFPKPSLLTEEDIIYVGISFRETIAYILSWGLAMRLVRKKLKEQTLGEYIRANPVLISRYETAP